MKRIILFLLSTVLILSLALPCLATEEKKGELKNLLEETFNSSLYTAETYAAYQAAASNAMDVYLDPAATEEQIDDTITEFKQAIEDLRPLIDSEKLLSFASDLEQEFMYNTNVLLSEDLMNRMSEACTEFRNLYESGSVTSEEILLAEDKFNTLVEEAEGAATEPSPFSVNDPKEGVHVPEDFKDAQKNTAGDVTKLRTTLVVVGSVFLIVGVVAVVFYFKPPKFLR